MTRRPHHHDTDDNDHHHNHGHGHGHLKEPGMTGPIPAHLDRTEPTAPATGSEHHIELRVPDIDLATLPTEWLALPSIP